MSNKNCTGKIKINRELEYRQDISQSERKNQKIEKVRPDLDHLEASEM